MRWNRYGLSHVPHSASATAHTTRLTLSFLSYQANAKRLQRLLAAEAEFESATKPGRNRFGRSSLTPPSAGLLANTDSNSPGYLRSIASPATSGVRLNAYTKRSARAATQFGSPLSNSPSSSASPVHGSPQIRRPWGFHAPEEANAAAARRAATPMKSPHRAYSGTPVRLNAHTKRPSAAERLPDSTSRRPLSSLAKYTDKDVSRRPLSSRSNYDSKERVSSSGRKSDLRNGSLKKKPHPVAVVRVARVRDDAGTSWGFPKSGGTLFYLSAGDCCPYIAIHATDTFFYLSQVPFALSPGVRRGGYDSGRRRFRAAFASTNRVRFGRTGKRVDDVAEYDGRWRY